VLFYTWGATKTYEEPVLGQVVFKTSPSGGARHPIEVYLFIRAVESLPSGIYHYSVEEHVLTQLQAGLDTTEVIEVFSNQEWVGNAALSFLMTGRLERSMWKYEHSHAFRVVNIDAGHLGQTVALVGLSLGLGVFTTAAINAKKTKEMLSIDFTQEIPIYGGSIGHSKSVIPQNSILI
jgi:SagB-type dehydrogenase family enzyme